MTTLPPKWRPWLTLLMLTACLYVPFRSCSLDDFDAYSFVLALDTFDLGLQQPQPPGFPVYVFLARGVYALTGDALSALTWLSVWSGVGSVLLVYALGVAIGKDAPHSASAPRDALIAPLLLLALPMLWLTATKPLSDMPGLFFTLLALWLWVVAQGRPLWLMGGGWAAGLSLGVRPQNALPLVLWLAWMGIQILRRERPWRHVGFIAIGGAVGVLLWLLPTAQAAGGLEPYIAYIQAHAAHVRAADSLWGMMAAQDGAASLRTVLRARAFAFGDTFLLYTVGVGTFAAWDAEAMARVGTLALVMLIGLARADWRRAVTWSLAVWTLAALIFVFLFVTLDRPRLMLPIVPPLVLLIAQGWARVRHPRWLAAAMMAGGWLLLVMQGTPLAAQLATTPAPPAQAAEYVAAHFPPEQTLVAAAGSFRAVQVELPAYRVAFLYDFSPQVMADALAAGLRYVVVFDRDQFPPAAMDVLNDSGTFVPLDEMTYKRDRRVHTQHDQVRVQVLTRAEFVPPDALRLPEDGCLDIGGASDGRYLSAGWFRPEDVGGTLARWAGGTVSATLRVTLPPAAAYRVRMQALAYPPEQKVQVQIATHSTVGLVVPQGWRELSVDIPGDWVTPEAITTLTLLHTHALSPQSATDGGSSDTRPLAAAYDWLCITPIAAPDHD